MAIKDAFQAEVNARLAKLRPQVEQDVIKEMTAGKAQAASAGATSGRRRGRPPKAVSAGSEAPKRRGRPPKAQSSTGPTAEGKPQCSVNGCNKPAIARGMCSAHYQKARYHEKHQTQAASA